MEEFIVVPENLTINILSNITNGEAERRGLILNDYQIHRLQDRLPANAPGAIK